MSQNSTFHNTHTSIPITRSEEHNCAQPKIEEGVCLSLEAIRIAEEEEEVWLEAEEESRLIEEARVKAEEEEHYRLRSDK